MYGWRSLLFVPAHDLRKVERATASPADAVILDLEDGVPVEAKAAARAELDGAVQQLGAVGKAVLVRVNTAWLSAVEDLHAAVIPGVTALMVPKIESAGRLATLSEMVGELTAERRISEAGPGLLPLIESPRGVIAAPEIAAARNVVGLALGSEDFSLELGVEPTAVCLDLPCRQVALAAACTGIMALAVPFSIAAYRDEEAIRAAATSARAFGATGALCIHPTQVAIANEVFVPSPGALADARAVLDAWNEAQARGQAVTSVGGRMIDAPVVQRASRLLARC